MRNFIVILLLLLSSTVYGQQFYQSPFTLRQGGLSGGGPVTSAHENTHGVNSKLRQRYGGNCYFISREKSFVKFAKTPPSVRLRQVANRCKHRGGIFNLYMVQSLQWWDDTPLYPFDEWSAYMNGSYTQLFISSDRGTSDHSIGCMLEMGYYSYVATECIPDSWQDKNELKKFWNWMARRSISLSGECRKRGMYGTKHRKWREILQPLIN